MVADGLVFGDVPPVMDIVIPGARPMAFTNPVFVDFDGDSDYDAPGTPLVD